MQPTPLVERELLGGSHEETFTFVRHLGIALFLYRSPECDFTVACGDLESAPVQRTEYWELETFKISVSHWTSPLLSPGLNSLSFLWLETL